MTLREKFIMFAKWRAEDSKGTPYEWDFDLLYPTDKDVEYFIAIIEDNHKYDWKTGEHWDDIMDWFEDLPTY